MSRKQQITALVTEARAIADRAKGADRNLTRPEQTRVETLLGQARTLKSQDDRSTAKASDDALRKQMADFGDSIGLDEPGPYGGREPKSGDQARTGKAGLGSYRPVVSAWAAKAREDVERVAAQGGVKALVSGSITTSAPLADPNLDYATMATDPQRLVDLLVDRKPIGDTNTFSYLVQTARTNNARPVADGEEKPTSIYTMEEREGRARVIAHLSEATPERFFSDSAELERFLESEMEEGLLDAVEYQLIRGDGTGENLVGLMNTSGTFAQPWNTNLVTTLRKARTKLRVAKEKPTGWAVHPEDQEAIDLLREGADGALLTGPFGQVIQGQLPIVETLAVAPGAAWLADWRLLQLIVRQEATLDADRSGELFRRNQVQMRLEGRYGSANRRPSAFCRVATKAPA